MCIRDSIIETAKKAAAAAAIRDGFGTAAALSEAKDRAELLAVLDAAFEISANEIYNINAALTAAYFTTVFAR